MEQWKKKYWTEKCPTVTPNSEESYENSTWYHLIAQIKNKI